MSAGTVVLITLIAYKLLLIGIGLWAQKRTRSSDDFFLGGRALGPVVAAISYSASSSSAWTLLGMSGAAFVMGLSALWLVAGAISGMLVAWIWVAPRLHKLSHAHGLVTLTDLLLLGVEDPLWRRRIARLAAGIVLLAFAFYVAAQFQGAGQTFADTFGLSMHSSILIGAAVILVYTLLGGFWAVSLTDTIQGALMAFAALLLPLAALHALGGWSGFVEGLQAVSSPEQWRWSGRHSGLAALGFVLGIAGIAFGTFGQPHLLVRFMALRDARALAQARWLTITWFAIVFGGMAFLGLAGHVLLPELQNPESVFFALTRELFPTLLGAVLIAAVLSAILSTADSQLLVGASAVAHDLGLNARYPQYQMWISRLAMLGLVVLAVVISLLLPASIFDRALLAWSALGAAFGPLLFWRIVGKSVPPSRAFSAMAAGFGTAIWCHFDPGGWLEATLPAGFPLSLLERMGSFGLGLLILTIPSTKTDEATAPRT